MKIKFIITISGRISAGKSYLAKLIQDEFGIPIASFGGYLKYYCAKKDLPIDRKILQDIGEAFVRNNPRQFSIDVLSHYIGTSNIILLEGVRHKSILEEVTQLCEKSLAIFIDADIETRYERYYSRNKDLDEVKTFEQFKIADGHLVETEIDSLKFTCDHTINSSNEDYWIELRDKIKNVLYTM